MRKQRLESFTQPKSYNLNSTVLSGRPPSLNNHMITEEQYICRLKQIKALKKFQDLFKKQYLKKDNNIQKYSCSIQQSQQPSPHQLSNRLKGMFFLKRKAELQYKYREQPQEDQYQQYQPDKLYPPIEGKAVSPIILKQRKQKQRYKQVDKVAKNTDKKNPDYLSYSRNISGKTIQQSFTPFRPPTQLQGCQKIFNNQTLYSAIIAANKAKIVEIQQPSFSYFNVYVQDGNNSQMIKSAVRKRSCWKVVQIPTVAHMIWSQWYRKNLDVKVKILKLTQKIEIKQKQRSQSKTSIIGNLTFLSESSIKKKKQQKQKNPNLISIQQYNKQIQKICPKGEHNRKASVTVLTSSSLYFYNHIPNNHNISDKTNLLRNMKKLYEKRGQNIFQVMPFSIDISQICQVGDLQQKIRNSVNTSGYWIIKPGENSNRGKGITVCKGLQAAVEEINSRFIIKNNQPSDTENTLPVVKQNLEQIKLRKNGQTIILQKYIEPLLYFKRKFDIRMYMLVTNVNSKIRGYVYNEGYIRTSSKIFSMETFNRFVHLTNDAIQSRSADYGKYQQGNKVSWKNFKKWLETQGHSKFWSQFTNQYKKICKNILQSVKVSFIKKHSKRCSENLISFENKSYLFEKNSSTVDDQKGRERKLQKEGSKIKQKIYFQIFGLDFLIDNRLKTWLIQVNTNPALTTDCSRVVNSIIPKMIDNAFGIAVQPYLKNPPTRYFDSTKFQNNFETIFDDEWNS